MINLTMLVWAGIYKILEPRTNRVVELYKQSLTGRPSKNLPISHSVATLFIKLTVLLLLQVQVTIILANNGLRV